MKLRCSDPPLPLLIDRSLEEDNCPSRKLHEVDKFDANSPLAILFLHEYGIRDPVGVEYFLNEASLMFAIDFIAYGATLFFVHTPRLLLYWLSISLNRELAVDDLEFNFTHIGRRPGKYKFCDQNYLSNVFS